MEGTAGMLAELDVRPSALIAYNAHRESMP